MVNLTISYLELQIKRNKQILKRLKENQFIYHDNKSYSEGLAKGLEMKLSTLESVLKTAKEEKDIYKKVFGERLPV